MKSNIFSLHELYDRFKFILYIFHADAGYPFDPYKGRPQTGYNFIYNGTTISWR